MAKGETIVRKHLGAPSKRLARVDPALRIAEMQLTVMLTGSQLAADIAAPLVARLDAPTLERMLERGRKSEESISPRGMGAEDWLAHNVFGDGVTAPYAWADLTGQRETEQTVWHADPIHLGIGRESVIIGSLAEDPLSDAEADALIAAANESLGDAARLSRVGASWFLHAREAWQLEPLPLAAAVGRPFATRGSLSDDELHWNRLHNAVQMTWHAHPVNESREADSRPTAGGLWLHGGGKWKPRPPLPWPALHSDRPELRGAAASAGAEGRVASAPVTQDALLVWDEAAGPQRQQDWQAWLAAMCVLDRRLAALPPASLTLVLAGDTGTCTWKTRATDRLRFWRSHRLEMALREPTS